MMQYLLSRKSRSVLTQLANQKTLCAFDFDGTLAPIVAHPSRAGMNDRTRSMLQRLALLYPCVVISGRARADVLERLNGVKVARIIGNHGAETEQVTGRSRRLVRQWRSVVEPELAALAGLWIEDKGLSLAVHYRQCVEKREVRRRIMEVVRSLPHVRIVGGKQVVNVVEAKAPHKGDVLESECRRLACNWILYVGDDENDEDAFALNGNIVAVRIGRSRRSHARYYLRTQSEIVKVIELLCSERPNGSDR